MKNITEQNKATSPSPLSPLVVHVIWALGTGGLENGLVNLINRCPQSRYRHVIVCLTHAQQFASRITAPGMEIIELNKRAGHDLGMYWHLWRELRRLRPDIVHTRNLAALETQVIGLFFPGCKRIHGEHGWDMHDLEGQKRKYHWLRRALSPLIHRFITVSQDLSSWLVDRVGIPEGKVTQIYNGVDKLKFASETQHSPLLPSDMPARFRRGGDRIILGTVGRLVPVKDQRLLLNAIHQLLSARPELRARLRLMIIGDGPEHSNLAMLTEKLDLGDLVWLAGEREDIPTLLRNMDIFALPSLGEGISNTLLEAMSTGLPVIATAVGGNPELVTDWVNGLLIPAANSEAMSTAIATLIDDPPRRAAMGQAARRRIHRDFDWDNTLSAYLSVYDELLLSEPSPPLRAGS